MRGATSHQLTCVPVHRFLAHRSSYRQTLVPQEPGIYYWTLDHSSYLHGKHFEQLNNNLSRSYGGAEGSVGLFYQVQVFQQSTELTPAKVQAIDELTNHDQLLEWLCWIANTIQHPLYVGKSRNLYRRLNQHLQEGSPLQDYLSEHDVRIIDCAFVYVALPHAAPPLGTDKSASLANAEQEEPFDEEEPLDQEEPLDDSEWIAIPGLPPSLLAVDLAESLAIKGSRPFTGKRRG